MLQALEGVDRADRAHAAVRAGDAAAADNTTSESEEPLPSLSVEQMKDERREPDGERQGEWEGTEMMWEGQWQGERRCGKKGRSERSGRVRSCQR